MTMKRLQFPKPGASDLLELPPTKRLKMSVVNVTAKDIGSQLMSALMVKLHSVTISGQENSLASIVTTNLPFNSVKNHIKVDINTENFLPLSSVLEDVSAEKKTSLVNNLTGLITASVIAIHGINDPRVQSGRLGAHREWNDRQYIRTILMSLPIYNGEEESSSRRVCADEILFKLPDGKHGFHGSLDMLTGLVVPQEEILSVVAQEEEILSPTVIVNHRDRNLEIRDAHFVEAKSASGTPLVGGDVMNISESPGASGDGSDASSPQPEAALTSESIKDINTTAQPIAEILAVAQIQKSEPTVLFYMNRFLFRPFIYFKSFDVLLTTTGAYEWNTEDNLNVHGVVLMALLMRALQFRKNLGGPLVKFGLKPTGFGVALGEQNIYQDATLSSQELKKIVNRKGATPLTGEESPIRKQVHDKFMDAYNNYDPNP